MRIIGIDIGTTTLSAAVVDTDTGASLHSETHSGPGFMAAEPWARVQDADELARRAEALVDRLSVEFDAEAVGLTGQMHGVVPVNREGRAVGPLYTWQDGRGALDGGGRPFSEALSEEIGLPLASGYGLVTHVFNRRRGLAHPDTASLATAAAYLGMRLTGRKSPLLHASDAASLGGYRADRHAFDPLAEAAAEGALPESTPCARLLGETKRGLPVAAAIGDNQASFLGTVGDREGGVLVNIGTGAQVSVCSARYAESPAFDTRPYVNGRYLLAVSPLCGGRSYALLERFLRECARLAGVEVGGRLYEAMNALAERAADEPLTIDTRFCGTRREPGLRGSVSGLSETNFTPAHFIRATLEGMARELFEGFEAMRPYIAAEPDSFSASGNAVKRNPALRRILSDMFGLPLLLSPYDEEAARGAALFAGMCLGA